MNTIRSTWVGWGALCFAGGGAYIFAKRSVNADRVARHENAQKRKEEALQVERESSMPTNPIISRTPEASKPPIPVAPTPNATPVNTPRHPSSEYSGGIADATRQHQSQHQSQPHGGHMHAPDDVANPSQEAAHDPAATRHEPETDAQRVSEKGKYEATEPYRSRRGNRLS